MNESLVDIGLSLALLYFVFKSLRLNRYGKIKI